MITLITRLLNRATSQFRVRFLKLLFRSSPSKIIYHHVPSLLGSCSGDFYLQSKKTVSIGSDDGGCRYKVRPLSRTALLSPECRVSCIVESSLSDELLYPARVNIPDVVSTSAVEATATRDVRSC